MVFEDIRHIRISVDFDLEDLKLLREVLLSFDPHLIGMDTMKYAAFSAMGAAFHAAVVACEALPEA